MSELCKDVLEFAKPFCEFTVKTIDDASRSVKNVEGIVSATAKDIDAKSKYINTVAIDVEKRARNVEEQVVIAQTNVNSGITFMRISFIIMIVLLIIFFILLLLIMYGVFR